MRILNVGCGPVTPGVTPGIEMLNIDRRAHEGATIGDMEGLAFEDNTFDVVVCINALDHTKDVMSALSEFDRVTKKGGYIYIDCALIQKTTSGKGHYWDVLEDGTITNGEDHTTFFRNGYEIELIDNKMARRYNHVIARKQV